jgi:hypothetical protein
MAGVGSAGEARLLLGLRARHWNLPPRLADQRARERERTQILGLVW